MDTMPRCPGCGEVGAAAVLGELCPRCVMRRIAATGSLVESDPTADSVETTVAGVVGTEPESTDPTRTNPSRVMNETASDLLGPPTQFGDYRIQGVLGQGGMGVVYLARQLSLGRLVALKMVRHDVALGESERRRFRNESLAVARLDHPGIVPIHEVGEFHGRPFFSMRRIEGGSLDRRLREQAQDPRAAASMMIAIAEAIHHAHVRGILHRDLKPANVLIDDEGRPVVTDFGLAKRLEGDDEQTQTGAVLGTPAYTSPEQAQGIPSGVTTASDVYGLGAIFYAMLTGRAPHKGSSPMDTLQAVRDQPPIPPRKVNPSVPRDLETICLKCLEKNPNGRYSSAQALADDLGNWLEDRPIEARPTGLAERFGLWCRRNPTNAGLIAALLLATVAGVVGILMGWRNDRRHRDLLIIANKRYDRQLRTTQAINAVLTDGFLNHAYPLGRGQTVGELLDRIGPSIDNMYRDQPDLESAVRRVVGDVYRAQGRFDEAEKQLARALSLSEQPEANDENGHLANQHALGALRHDQGRLDEARVLAESALEGRRRLLGGTHEETIASANLLAAILRARGRSDQAWAMLEPLATPARASLGASNPNVLLTDSNLAALALDLNQLQEAERRTRDVLDRLREIRNPSELILSQARNNLGAILWKSGRLAEAETEQRAILDWARGILDANHPLLKTYLNNLATVILDQGRTDEAVQLLQQALDGTNGPEIAETIRLKATLAAALTRRGEFDQAEPLMRQVAAWALKHGRPDPVEWLMNHGSVLAELHRWNEAVAPAAEALGILERDPSANHAKTNACRLLIGGCLLDLGQAEKAAPLLEQAYEARSADPATPPWQLATSRARLGALRAIQGDRQSAETLLLEAWKTIEPDKQAPAVRRREVLARIIGLYENWPGREADAEPWIARLPAQPQVSP